MGDSPQEVLTAPLVLEYPFNRTTGPVIGAYVAALGSGKIVGIKGSDGRVICPPVEYDPRNGDPLTDLVMVGTSGTVTSWSWSGTPREGQTLKTEHALALIKLDGADTSMMHVVDVVSPDDISVGARVQARFSDERSGTFDDLICFDLEGAES